MEFLGYIGALCIGLIMGLTGSGGSILAVPIYVYLFNLNPLIATTYSFFTVGTTSIVGVIQKEKLSISKLKEISIIALPMVIGVFISRKWIITKLPNKLFSIDKESILMILFAFFMIYSSYLMLNKRKTILKETKSVINLSIKLFFTGILIGLLGAGGGFLIIPLLIIGLKIPMKQAITYSLSIICINSCIGFLSSITNLDINWGLLLRFSVLSIIGIFVGNYFSSKISDIILKKIFAWLVLIIAFVILLNELS